MGLPKHLKIQQNKSHTSFWVAQQITPLGSSQWGRAQQANGAGLSKRCRTACSKVVPPHSPDGSRRAATRATQQRQARASKRHVEQPRNRPHLYTRSFDTAMQPRAPRRVDGDVLLQHAGCWWQPCGPFRGNLAADHEQVDTPFCVGHTGFVGTSTPIKSPRLQQKRAGKRTRAAAF